MKKKFESLIKELKEKKKINIDKSDKDNFLEFLSKKGFKNIEVIINKSITILMF